jgi:hypothetical protein
MTTDMTPCAPPVDTSFRDKFDAAVEEEFTATARMIYDYLGTIPQDEILQNGFRWEQFYKGCHHQGSFEAIGGQTAGEARAEIAAAIGKRTGECKSGPEYEWDHSMCLTYGGTTSGPTDDGDYGTYFESFEQVERCIRFSNSTRVCTEQGAREARLSLCPWESPQAPGLTVLPQGDMMGSS